MKICLVAHFAYGALTGEETGHIGGVERQSALFSEWLADRGHEVSVVTWDEGDIERVGNVRIIKLCRQEDGIPGLRFFVPRWSSLVRALADADAEIYYQNCAEYVTGQVALWCHRHERPFVYSVASDADCDATLPNLEHWRAKALFRYGLRHADLVIAQTFRQKEMLLRNFDVEARVIRMPGTPPELSERFTPESKFRRQRVIWVARVAPVKRIEWYIDIANALPDITFEVIGPINESEPEAKVILERIDRTPNLSFRGKVKRSDMPAEYQTASLLCCTSIYEGFPNTYLEAWSYGIPVVTTIDPDGLIMAHDMGIASPDKAKLIEGIRSILSDESTWRRMSNNARSYYLENHQLDPIQKKFEHELLTMTRYGPTLIHFEQESKQWSEYYQRAPSTLSHLDVQARLTNAAAFLNEATNGHKGTFRILDLGCGTGDALNVKPAYELTEMISADYSLGMIRTTLANHENAHGVVADAVALPFPNAAFDCLLALGLFEYIDDVDKALMECARIVRQGGDILVSMPNKKSFFRRLRNVELALTWPVKFISQLLFNTYPSKHYNHQQWNPDEIRNLLANHGFIVQEMAYCTYGLLSPKLASSAWNLWLCRFLNDRVSSRSKWQPRLANTIIVRANAEASSYLASPDTPRVENEAAAS